MELLAAIVAVLLGGMGTDYWLNRAGVKDPLRLIIAVVVMVFLFFGVHYPGLV